MNPLTDKELEKVRRFAETDGYFGNPTETRRFLATIDALKEEAAAWKLLHDAKGPLVPYGYASRKQFNAIQEAKKIVGQ